VLGGDDEELDVFLIGVNEAVSTYTGRIIGIVYRADDVEDKLVMAPAGQNFTAEEIARAVLFQERYYQTTIRAMDGSTAQVSELS
jgi:inorganic pyrophosphatase